MRSSTKRKLNVNIKFSIPFHAQEKLFCLLIVVEMTSNFRQEIRYSYYRNDPVKYDLNFQTITPLPPVEESQQFTSVLYDESGVYWTHEVIIPKSKYLYKVVSHILKVIFGIVNIIKPQSDKIKHIRYKS